LRGPLSAREVGAELHLSVNTVKTHTKSLYRKLNVSSREEAVVKAHELGLI
jgi:LuxR family maltose regulon positive regulatory protein